MNGISGRNRQKAYHKQTQAYRQSRNAHDPVGSFRPGASHFHAALHKAQDHIHHQSQKGDQKAAHHGHGCVVGGTAGADKGSDTGQGNGHGYHTADTGHDHRHCQRQFDFPEHLKPGASHALCRLQNGRVNVGYPGVSVSHHGKQRVHRQGDDRRGVPDAGKGNQKTQH